MIKHVVSSRLALPVLFLALNCVSAQAQYQWRDANGRMVFSDLPAPANIDPSKVIRSDSGRVSTPQAARTVTKDAAGDGSKPQDAATSSRNASGRVPTATRAESAADKELAAKRKAQLQADADKKKREEAEQTAKVARACEDMRTEVRTLETGMRVSRVNSQGEREFLSDEERNRRVASVQRDIKEHCKQG